MIANKPMTGEQLDELMTVAVNMQRDAETDCNRPSAMFAYAVQVAVLELRKVRNDASALAAELLSVKAMNDCLSEELRGYESDGAFEGPKMHLLWWQCETPNHDAFLAEVRAQGVKSLSNAVQSVISERQRQQSVEGWTPKHDDKHDNNELAFAASCYAFHSAAASWDFEDDGTPYDIHPAPKNWPWASEWWKPTNPRRDLVKAGALILAEIERIDRQEAAQ